MQRSIDLYSEKGYDETWIAKKIKGINMDSLDLILTDLSEETTKRLANKRKSRRLKENIKVAKIGGEVALNTRNNLEDMLGEEVITKNNVLTYQYNEDNNLLENKERVMMNDK